ncbi:MAG: S41 family peptidase [Bacteroidia bacterium]|nr:S41 family peptidase [Bacteroidia bacterium]
MDKKTRRIIIWSPIVLVAAISIGIYLGISLQNQRQAVSRNIFLNNANKIGLILNLVEKNYVDTVDSKRIIENGIPEILKQLDPHTVYIPAKDMVEVSEEMAGNFSGIGVQFSIQNDTIMVIDVISGGPSQKLGIRAGDRIVRVNDSIMAGVKVTNDKVLKKLRGVKGTKVKVGIARKGFSDLIAFDIIRGEIPLNSVDVSYMINAHTGFIKVGRFAEKTYDEFMTGVEKLDKAGADQLVIDLRGNPGGYLGAVISMVNEFLDMGELVVYTEGRTQPKRSFNAEKKGAFFGKKVIVLVDEYSASASEIFAGAIQDNDRGTIIGRRTFGKGLVQEQVPFYDGSAIRLTVARYYTPSGRCIQKSYKNGVEEYNGDIKRRYTHGELEQKDSIRYADTKKYYTRKNRVVYGGGGIMPDLFIAADTSGMSPYYSKIVMQGLVYQYAFEFSDTHRAELGQFKSGKDFEKYLTEKHILSLFTDFTAKKGIIADAKSLQLSGKIIETQLMAYIARNLVGEVGFYEVISNIDNTLLEALKALETKNKLVKSN